MSDKFDQKAYTYMCEGPATIDSLDEIMFEEKSEDLQTRKVVIIGSVGAGKTSVSRYCTGLYGANTAAAMSGHSVTKGVHTYKGSYIAVEGQENTKIQYTATDTEGYGADSFSSDELRNQLLNALRFETELNCVVVVVSFERFRNGLREDLKHLIQILGTLGLDEHYTLVCFTHCELFSDKVRQSYVDEFRKYYGFNIDNKNIIYGCFPNYTEVRDEYRAMVGNLIKKSIHDLRGAINGKVATVNVAMKIADIEKVKPVNHGHNVSSADHLTFG